MKSTRQIITLPLFAMLLSCGLTANCQFAITPIGGDVTNEGGSVSFSCGEVAVRSSEARAITVINITEYFTEGVQQAYASTMTDIVTPLPFKVEVYPNPTQDIVEISLDGMAVEQGLHLTLYNLQGQALLTSDVQSANTRIDLSAKPAGIYMLHLDADGGQGNNVYKIIKR